MGVTLLERNRYSDALVTIRDALFLVHAVSGSTYTEIVQVTTDSDIKDMLLRATNCLISSNEAISSPQGKVSLRLTILSDSRSSSLDVLNAVNQADAYLVRIDDTINPTESYGSLHAMHSIVSAMILNYSTACQCLQLVYGGRSSTKGPDADFMYEALSFLRMSYGILTRQVQPELWLSNRKHFIANELAVSRTLNLSTLVLQSLMNVCYQLGFTYELFAYESDFDCIYRIITRLNYIQFWRYNETAPMA
jgi:hypothetical protein